MTKYQLLSERLTKEPAHEWRATFSELEDLLGFPLPKAARSADAWWSNSAGKPHNRAWTASGWEVSEVDRDAESVTFRRPVSEAALQSPAAAQGVRPAAVRANWRRVSRRLGAQRWRRPALAVGGAALSIGAAVVIVAMLRRRRRAA